MKMRDESLRAGIGMIESHWNQVVEVAIASNEPLNVAHKAMFVTGFMAGLKTMATMASGLEHAGLQMMRQMQADTERESKNQ